MHIARPVVFTAALAILLAAPVNAQTFVRVTGDQFTHNGTVYRVKGSNYYPQNHMWAAMWSSWDWTAIADEVQRMKGLGMNSVRILVPYSNGGWGGANVPSSRLQMLEDVVNEFGENGIRSCVTLFDWETSFPAAGTATEANHIAYLNAIVTRLKNNPYVFVWDVKNEPDHPSNIGGFDNWDSSPANRDKIVSWLQRMCNAVRARDPNHYASAGIRWWQNVQDVIAFEDVAMFHSYWPNIGTQQIPDVKGYMGSNQKPIIVEEFGWPSNPSPGYNGGVLTTNFTEADQLSFYQTHMGAFAQHNIAGCIQWMTFDATYYSGDPNHSFENHFGLWRYGYSLKPAGAYYRDNFLVNPFPVEPDTTPPGPVTLPAAMPSRSFITVSWVNPSNRDFQAATVRFSTTGYPATVNDGQFLADVAGARGTTSTTLHTGLLVGTRYYYSIFAHDRFNNYATGAKATAVSFIPGDFDNDGDIDMGDYAHLQECLSGVGIPQVKTSCADTLLDDDPDVDMDDLRIILNCMSGAKQPPAPDCNS